MLTDREPAVRISAAAAIRKLAISQAAPALLAVLKSDKETDIRVECLSALVALKVPQQEEAITFALADNEKQLRVAALDLLENMEIPKPVMVDLLANVIDTKTTEEKQAAIVSLGKIPVAHSAPLINRLLDQMEADQLSPEVYLELGEAIDSIHAEPLVKRYQAITEHFSADKLMASYASSLEGGDIRRGQRVFFQHQQAQCMKCHAYDDRGGNAGPQLNGVADSLSRQQLLEALIDPSKRIAPGYGVVMLTLNNGEQLSGIYQGEDQQGVKIRKGQEPDQVIRHSDIREKTFSPSSMLDMKGILSKREIRDVVAFLATLKEQ